MIPLLNRVSIRSVFCVINIPKMVPRGASTLRYSFSLLCTRSLSTSVEKNGTKQSDSSASIEPDKEGSVNFSPGDEWIYHEEKLTGISYYQNTKTNEILYNRTRDSELAHFFPRLLAGTIDFSISMRKLIIALYCSRRRACFFLSQF